MEQPPDQPHLGNGHINTQGALVHPSYSPTLPLPIRTPTHLASIRLHQPLFRFRMSVLCVAIHMGQSNGSSQVQSHDNNSSYLHHPQPLGSEYHPSSSPKFFRRSFVSLAATSAAALTQIQSTTSSHRHRRRYIFTDDSDAAGQGAPGRLCCTGAVSAGVDAASVLSRGVLYTYICCTSSSQLYIYRMYLLHLVPSCRAHEQPCTWLPDGAPSMLSRIHMYELELRAADLSGILPMHPSG
jgi:hypothetical protein